MHEIQLAEIDLNQLTALDALLSERHVARAASRLGLTPSAMSHALARLRTTFEDDLLVRTRGGMTLTPRGEQLRRPLRRVLGEIGELLRGAGAFDPSTSRRDFTVAMTDYIEVMVLPLLLARIAAEAPGIHLRVRPLDRLDIDALLDGGDCDLVLGVSFDETTGLRQQVLFTEAMVFACRKGHPQVRRHVSLETYLQLRHVVISLRGGSQGSVDALLMAQGRRREVALLVPHFLAGLKIVERSDLVLTAPGRLVEQHGAGLQAMKPPLEIPGFTVRQVWHERMHNDPAHLWLRKQFFEVTAGLRGGRVRRSGSGRR